MKAICFHFVVHQPIRLKRYRFFQIGEDFHYYDDFHNKYFVERIAQRCYLPMNNLLLELIKKHKNQIRVSFSITGVALEQFQMYAPEVIESFRALIHTGCVELVAETYYHSLASLADKDEFRQQVEQHIDTLKQMFDYEPVTFRNTEMIYSDGIAEAVFEMGFDTILTEGAKHILGWRSPHFLYCQAANPRMKLLLRNFRLSDDIAFRFSNKSWNQWPLTADKFAQWLNQLPEAEEIVFLSMDYETFGEHQTKETGIFEFMKALPDVILKQTQFRFMTPREVSERFLPVAALTVDHPISWADEERDISAWLGNDLQKDAFEKIYGVDRNVLFENENLLNVWRRLQTSDHFYYMSTKWFVSGNVHQYFNPYPSPYEAYINFMNIVSDFLFRLEQHRKSGGQIIEGQNKITNTMENKGKRNSTAKRSVTKEVEKQKKEKSRKTRTKHVVSRFEDIVKISNQELAALLRGIPEDTIFAAVMSAGDNVKDKVLSNIGKRMLSRFETKMEQNALNYTEEEMQNARKYILKYIKSNR